MSKDKFRDKGGFGVSESQEQTDSASRARNRTVMLTPEMTGQVRAVLNKDKLDIKNPPVPGSDAVKDLLPPMGWGGEEETDGGFSSFQPVIKSAPTPIEDDFAEGNEKIESAPRFGQGFNETEVQMVRESGLKSGDTMHDMDTHQRPSFTVNPAKKDITPASSHALQPVAPKRKGKVIAFLVSYDKEKTGEIFEVSAGRWLITSKPTEHSDYIMLEDETVSPLHAFIRATDNGKVQVLDQLSEFGTFVIAPGATQEEEITGAMVALEHGSIVRFGNRRFVVCIIPPMVEPK